MTCEFMVMPSSDRPSFDAPCAPCDVRRVMCVVFCASCGVRCVMCVMWCASLGLRRVDFADVRRLSCNIRRP